MTGHVDGRQAEIEELRSSKVWLSVVPLMPAAFARYAVATRSPESAPGSLPGVFLLLLTPADRWLLHKSYYRAAALALVVGLFCANLLLIRRTVLAETAKVLMAGLRNIDMEQIDAALDEGPAVWDLVVNEPAEVVKFGIRF